MKPKLIALNLVLIAALGATVWKGREEWLAAQKKRNEIRNAAVKPVVTPPPAPTPNIDPIQPVKYADVATKNLFSKDRNPDVIIDPPKIEPPKPMPPLPVVYGVLGLPSGTRAIMAEKKGEDSRPVKTGDTVGEFKIVSLDTKNVTFDWDGKQISKNIDDLIDRSSPAGSGGQAAAAPAPGPAIAAAPAAKPAAQAAGPGKAQEGKTDRPCIGGDTSPNGAIVDGYKLTFMDSPFGRMNCRWSPVK